MLLYIKKCEWVGTVATLKNHEDNAISFQFPAQTNDMMPMWSKYRDLEHNRMTAPTARKCKCEYCGEKGTYVHTIHCPEAITWAGKT